jgi:hypothetical protein
LKETKEKKLVHQPTVVILRNQILPTTYKNKIMRAYLTIISLALFICAVPSRSIPLFSNEDDSSELQPETNRRYLKETILFNHLRNLLDGADDDDENTDSQQPSLRSESSEQDDVDDENTDSQPPPLVNQSSEQDNDNDNDVEFVRKKRQLSDNDDDTSSDEDEPVTNDLYNNDAQIDNQVFKNDEFSDSDDNAAQDQDDSDNDSQPDDNFD